MSEFAMPPALAARAGIDAATPTSTKPKCLNALHA